MTATMIRERLEKSGKNVCEWLEKTSGISPIAWEDVRYKTAEDILREYYSDGA